MFVSGAHKWAKREKQKGRRRRGISGFARPLLFLFYRFRVLPRQLPVRRLGVLAEKTKGNLSEAEDRTLQTVLFEARMAFLELTNMITLQGVPAPPPGKR